MKKQKYRLILFLFLTLLILPAAGCQKELINLPAAFSSNEFSTTNNNSIIQQAQADEPDDCLLYIINEPTDEEMAELLSYTMIKIDSEAATTLLIPRDQNSLLAIYNLIYNEETGSYEREAEVWSLDRTSKGFIAAAQLNYGLSGQPTYEVYIETSKAYGSYFFELPAEAEEAMPHIDYLQKQGNVVSIQGLD